MKLSICPKCFTSVGCTSCNSCSVTWSCENNVIKINDFEMKYIEIFHDLQKDGSLYDVIGKMKVDLGKTKCLFCSFSWWYDVWIKFYSNENNLVTTRVEGLEVGNILGKPIYVSYGSCAKYWIGLSCENGLGYIEILGI